jgi:pimeloyl-ACP methyl ester carboxylesterase
VVLLHGLDEPGRIWDDAAPAILAAGLAVARFDYPNDQAIAASADLLLGSLAALGSMGVRTIDAVAHSMGGLVARDALTRSPLPAGLPRANRLITVGTPNKGSPLARHRWVAEAREQIARWAESPGWTPPGSASAPGERGRAGVDLMPGSAFFTNLDTRPLPDATMTIILGRLLPVPTSPNAVGRALLDAMGDGVVSVASARLAGVRDVVELKGTHRGLIRNVSPTDAVRTRLGRAPKGAVPPAIPVIVDRLLRPAE